MGYVSSLKGITNLRGSLQSVFQASIQSIPTVGWKKVSFLQKTGELGKETFFAMIQTINTCPPKKKTTRDDAASHSSWIKTPGPAGCMQSWQILRGFTGIPN